jgi:hypothetical protein
MERIIDMNKINLCIALVQVIISFILDRIADRLGT